ncbi:MAG: 3-phosphoshikimate 1-carboxyvinyltransferase [Candidatus Dasytiphilus stammeri]
MSDFLTLHPISLINGRVDLPGSKSISNRALLLAAQAHGITILKNLLDSDDVRYMLKALSKMGIKYELSKSNTICKIVGCGGPLLYNNIMPKKSLELFLGNAGTAMRPLTAALSLTSNDVILTGEARMKERPIGYLVDSLRQGGANIDYLEQTNYPPIRSRGGFTGGKIIIDGSYSSQFLSAVLIAAPLALNDTNIKIKGKLISRPYIDITLNLLRHFGIRIENKNYLEFQINGNQRYISPGTYIVEGDASSASYFLAAAAIKGGTVHVTGLGCNSIQGDIYFAEILKNMGAKIQWSTNKISCQRGSNLTAIDLDMNTMPDVAMTLATMSIFAKGTTILRNIYSWRLKETDRLKAMTTELRKIGANVIEGRDYICITPPKKITSSTIETYNDHRMAMCFSLVALSSVPITIINPNCVNKTYPNYFSQLRHISHY